AAGRGMERQSSSGNHRVIPGAPGTRAGSTDTTSSSLTPRHGRRSMTTAHHRRHIDTPLGLLLACCVVVLSFTACRSSAEPTESKDEGQAAPTSATTREDIAAASEPDEPDVSADTAQAAPEPEPEPEPVVAPDGTVIEPCGQPPEGMVCVPGGPFIRGYDDDPHTECNQRR